MKPSLLLCALSLAAGCVTPVSIGKGADATKAYYNNETGCMVHDYPGASDVPEGSKPLGVVQVPREQTDEDTYVKLREAICARGGNALSQLHWVSETTAAAPMIFALEANAWVQP